MAVAMVAAIVAVPLSTDACEALNVQRNIDTHRTNQVTKAVLCETQPAPCISEFLFGHEFYWSEKKARASGGVKCSMWTRDENWPTLEPHLQRPAGLGGIWESVLSAMPNRTLWLHGDSIMTQVCEASICSLLRSAVVPQPPLCTGSDVASSTTRCTDVDALARSVGMQLRAIRLPNGARLLCSAVGAFERDKIAAVLRGGGVDVAVFNYGLHYHTNANFGQMLATLFDELKVWAAASGGRVPLFRELSAQHFKGGSYSPGAERPPPGTPCQCEPLQARAAKDASERTLGNQNVEFNRLAALAAAERGVGIVPFYNLTAPRHDMHRRHFCSFSNQKKVGRCCDCTHFCYTPLFWDVFFSTLGSSIRSHPQWDRPRLVEDDGAEAVEGAKGIEQSRLRERRAWRRRARRRRRDKDASGREAAPAPSLIEVSLGGAVPSDDPAYE